MKLEHVEPDYSSAAEAWMVMEMTKEIIRHRNVCIEIAHEYEKRFAAEARRESGEVEPREEA